jgi:hypothetical protein
MTDTVKGRDRIAARLGRCSKTISNWVRAGILQARKAGPFVNSPLEARADHLDHLVERYGSGRQEGD